MVWVARALSLVRRYHLLLETMPGVPRGTLDKAWSMGISVTQRDRALSIDKQLAQGIGEAEDFGEKR